jgi:anti-sigma factor RsiW
MTNKALESLLREALREQPRSEKNSCPSLQELTAFVERHLPSAERARVDAHLTECHRCIADAARLYRGLKAAAPPKPSWWRAQVQSLSERWQAVVDHKAVRVGLTFAKAAVLIFTLLTAAVASHPSQHLPVSETVDKN